MSSGIFNPVLQTHIFKDVPRIEWWMKYLENSYKVGVEDDDCEIVFICGSQQVHVGMTTSFLIFPMLKEIISSAFQTTAGFGKKKDSKIWITLDDVEMQTLISLLQGITSNVSRVFSSIEIQKILQLMTMMKVNPSLLHFDILINHSQEATAPAPVTLNENMEVDHNQGSPVSSLETLASVPILKISGSKELTLHPRISGTKRKNLNEAIENIASKKKAKEESKYPKSDLTLSSVPEAISEVNAIDKDKMLAGNYSQSFEDQPPGPVYKVSTEAEKFDSDVKTETMETCEDIKEEKEVAQPMLESQEIDCPESDCKSSQFKSRSEFLHHYALQHILDQFLENYPFTKNNGCNICLSNGSKKKISSKTKVCLQKKIAYNETFAYLGGRGSKKIPIILHLINGTFIMSHPKIKLCRWGKWMGFKQHLQCFFMIS